jgi:hypothetical protein
MRHRARRSARARRAWAIRNPATPEGYHLRRGMLVLWRDERDHYLLARIQEARPSAAHAAGTDGTGTAAVIVQFPNGELARTPIDRLHELPRHESTARRRGRW